MKTIEKICRWFHFHSQRKMGKKSFLTVKMFCSGKGRYLKPRSSCFSIFRMGHDWLRVIRQQLNLPMGWMTVNNKFFSLGVQNGSYNFIHENPRQKNGRTRGLGNLKQFISDTGRQIFYELDSLLLAKKFGMRRGKGFLVEHDMLF